MTDAARNVTPQDRAAQLESIREFVPLKTYNAIAGRLAAESARLQKSRSASEARAARESAPQALPRDTFEERRMPSKLIRID